MKSENRRRKLPSYMNEDEYNRLISLVKKDHHRLAFNLAYNSGLRVGEVVKLKPEEIDIKGKRIFIKDSKWGKDRVVPLPKGFPAKYIKLIPLKCGIRALEIAFKNYVKKSGVPKPDLHFHSLRHSFAIKCMEKGIPLNQIQVLLGHENISTTSVYLKINPKDALDSYENLW
jgi:integrase/recombinase XerD